MDVIILPGFSLKNQSWANQISAELKPISTETYEWKHWNTGNTADFSAEGEAHKIITQLEKEGTIKTSVIAKSIGTFVLAEIIKHSTNLFDKIVLCGIPLNDLSNEEWNAYQHLQAVSAQSICFQNVQDPHGNFAQVSKFFAEKNIAIPVVKKLADNHDYCYSSDFKSFLSA